MAFQVPTCEPDQITAGDTASWKRSFQDFPVSEGWSLTYYCAPKGGESAPKKVTTTNDGFYFIVNQSTADWLPGDYYIQGFVTLNTERHQVYEGALNVRPNLAGANPGDIRTQARRTLDNIEAVLEGNATKEIEEWTVEGVQLRRRSVSDLLKLRDRFKIIVQKEEARQRVKNGKASRRRILTKFCKPGGNQTWPPGFVRG